MTDDPFNDPIIVQETRILRPSEYKQFKRGIPKGYYKTIFDALLCSGMRYNEFLEFQQHPKWFSEADKKIYLPKMAIKKKKVKRATRWIKLSDYGAQMIAAFIDSKERAPERRTWYDNLNRWARLANLNPDGINVKMTRKTYECWLLEYYGSVRGTNNITQILLSQGHTQETAINHYLSLPFSQQDRKDMEFMMSGWL